MSAPAAQASLRGKAVAELGRLIAELTRTGDLGGARVAALALADLAQLGVTATGLSDSAEVIDLASRRSR